MGVTDPYLVRQYASIHLAKTYGQTCHRYVEAIQACLVDLKPGVVVEYGCGQSELGRLVNHAARWVRYDPAIPGIDHLEEQRADFVINTDVLEHVPEADIDDLLADIAALSGHVFFSISTRPALEVLPDGQNAHCTVWPASRWGQVIRRRFPDVILAHERPGDSCVFVTWKSGVADLIGSIEDLKIWADRGRRRRGVVQRLMRACGRLVGAARP